MDKVTKFWALIARNCLVSLLCESTAPSIVVARCSTPPTPSTRGIISIFPDRCDNLSLSRRAMGHGRPSCHIHTLSRTLCHTHTHTHTYTHAHNHIHTHTHTHTHAANPPSPSQAFKLLTPHLPNREFKTPMAQGRSTKTSSRCGGLGP